MQLNRCDVAHGITILWKAHTHTYNKVPKKYIQQIEYLEGALEGCHVVSHVVTCGEEAWVQRTVSYT